MPAPVRTPPRPAFTLIEVLVVIAVIATLIAILLPALGGAKSTARAARELAAAQQLMTAFTIYSTANAGAILPGYTTPQMAATGLRVEDAEGRRIVGPEAQRFPWRLAPSLDYNFRGLYQSDQLLTEMRDSGMFQYVVSLYPSLAMNTEFVGGSAWNNLGFNPVAERTYGRHYVVRDDESLRPSELLCFASARANPDPAIPSLGDPRGYYRLNPPYLLATEGRKWEQAYDPRSSTPDRNSGHLTLRHQGKAVTAMLDGHGAMLGWDDLNDMRRWADGATSPTWALRPR